MLLYEYGSYRVDFILGGYGVKKAVTSVGVAHTIYIYCYETRGTHLTFYRHSGNRRGGGNAAVYLVTHAAHPRAYGREWRLES